MGSTRRYECPSCGYGADVAGSRDCGFIAVTETISCEDCRKLYDAVANEKASDALMENGEIRSDLTGIRCPKSRAHKFSSWTGPGPCPKCGTTMETDGLESLWD